MIACEKWNKCFSTSKRVLGKRGAIQGKIHFVRSGIIDLLYSNLFYREKRSKWSHICKIPIYEKRNIWLTSLCLSKLILGKERVIREKLYSVRFGIISFLYDLIRKWSNTLKISIRKKRNFWTTLSKPILGKEERIIS